MKKFIAIALCAVIAIATLTGCGNQSLGFGNFTYEKVHIDTYHYSGCLTVETWYENETGVEMKTKECGSIFLSEGTYIMLGGDKECPFCKYGKGDAE